ncbi:MAG: DedA family protein [Methylobacter sp.]
MQQIQDLIHQYHELFYPITFFWTALEGETFVVFAGLAAQQGALNVWLLFLAAWLGSMCGDQFFFLLGRKFGARILNRFPSLAPGVNRSFGWIDKYAVAFILSYRFMYGLRNVSGIAVGLSRFPWQRFMFWNTVASFIWATAFIGFGYLFGKIIDHMPNRPEDIEDEINQVTLTVLGLFAFIVIVKLATLGVQKYKKRQRI